MYKSIILIFSLLFLHACSGSKLASGENELDNLLAMMTGSFDSSAQEAADSAFYNISLQMYEIWPDQSNNLRWIYVEQALASTPESPYRQRVYKLEKVGDKQFLSSVYTLPDPELMIGAWRTPEKFSTISTDDLTERTGCGVLLNKITAKHYKGQTGEKTCGSTLRGASYATSIVELRPGQINSWDQGWDADGNQVWGAVKGGYEFKIQ